MRLSSDFVPQAVDPETLKKAMAGAEGLRSNDLLRPGEKDHHVKLNPDGPLYEAPMHSHLHHLHQDTSIVFYYPSIFLHPPIPLIPLSTSPLPHSVFSEGPRSPG